VSDDATDLDRAFDAFPHNGFVVDTATAMDWGEWLEPEPLLRYLHGRGRADHAPVGRRKLRLLACGVCRRAWPRIEPHPAARACVEFAEGFADGDGAKKRLRKLVDACRQRYDRYGERPGEDVQVVHAAAAARTTCEPEVHPIASCRSVRIALGGDEAAEAAAQAALVRCVFGDPFRPVPVASEWRSADAIGLARAIYADRAFDRLPILADALEEAGCGDPAVLAHCRADVIHARGCWVVDAVLGR
jgi:hypothetical protein